MDSPSTPQEDYVTVCLRDLSADQIETEARLDKAEADLKRAYVIAVGAGLVGLMALSTARMALKAINQIGAALVQTQQHVGLLPSSPVPDQAPPGEQSVGANVPTAQEPENHLSTGVGYDPGPQEIPEEVKQAILSEPVNPQEPPV